MVKEIDVTQKRKGEKEIRDRTKGLIRKVFREDVKILGGPQDTAHLFVNDPDDLNECILAINRLNSTITVYIPSYENKAREIAKGYEEIVGKEVIFEIDYSNIS